MKKNEVIERLISRLMDQRRELVGEITMIDDSNNNSLTRETRINAEILNIDSRIDQYLERLQ